MKFPPWIADKVYGDLSYRGQCPKEGMEQATFFNVLRREYPDTLGLIALHPKNENKRSGKDFRTLDKDKALGMAVGASDIIIPGSPAFVCELKRKDHAACSWQPKQLDYLKAAYDNGAFVCVALGWEAAWQGLQDYLKITSTATDQSQTP